jgi:hypothetical protein
MSHDHPHDHPQPADQPGDALSRRRLLQGVGAVGAGLALSPAMGGIASAAPKDRPRQGDRPGRPYAYLAGDHHIHTKYSSDAIYEVGQHARKASEFGLDWIVITDHGAVTHQKFSVEQTAEDIAATRAAQPELLVYHGLEWNIPGGEHATVFVAPGGRDVATLKQFELDYDGAVLAATGRLTRAAENTAKAEELAYAGLRYLAEQRAQGAVRDVVMLANHVSRRGLDSPHELRGYRDATDSVGIGMEGAPGHQAAGIPVSAGGIGDDRGFYGSTPNADSHPGYGLERYFTYGGFDYDVTQVGGLWDSMLAEGLPFTITTTSDAHFVHEERFRRGGEPAQQTSAYYGTTGSYLPPVEDQQPQPAGDFWPGYYGSTLVAATGHSYTAVMEGLRRSRVYAVHGRLVDAVDLRVDATGSNGERGVTVGERTVARRGSNVVVTISVTLPSQPNFHGDLPVLAHVDLIAGPVTGPAADRDTLTAPGTRVVESFQVRRAPGRTVRLRYRFRNVTEPFYLRLRGSDGNQLDSAGNPLVDVPGDADPWVDLWFYSNPVFVDVA